MDGVFVGSGIFKSGDPARRARAIVQVGSETDILALVLCHLCACIILTLLLDRGNICQSANKSFTLLPSHLQAVTHHNNPAVLAEVSAGLGEAMVGIDIREKGFNSYAQRSE
jgi:pyridoxal 5'-phosphate synthase pdxS subunit